jgi:hypothetical protein
MDARQRPAAKGLARGFCFLPTRVPDPLSDSGVRTRQAGYPNGIGDLPEVGVRLVQGDQAGSLSYSGLFVTFR